MQDAWRAYMELALGLTEASRKKATQVAKQLIGKGGATAEQLQGLAEDLLKTGTANREAMTKLVRYELDRALAAVGLATAEEVADLNARIRDLEQRLQEAEGQAAAPQAAAPVGAPTAAPARKSAAARKTTTSKTTTAGKTTTVTKTTAPKKAAAKKAAAKKAVARKKATAKPAGAA